MNLGELIVSLGLDDDDFTVATSGVEDQLSSIESNLNAIAAIEIGRAIVDGLSAIGDVVSDLISDFADAEQTTARFETTLSRVAHASGVEIESLSNLSDELERKNRIDADVTRMGISQLATFQMTTESINRLVPAMQNLMAGTAGLAANEGTALQVANMLGKAYSGQAEAMSRVGISMSDMQKGLIENGTEAQKVATLIEVINQNYGGLAESMANTKTGILKEVEITIGNIRENLGEGLIDAVSPSLEKMSGFLSMIAEIDFKEIFGSDVVQDILKVTGLIGGISLALLAIPAIVAFIGNPFTLLVGGSALVVSAISNNFKGINSIFDDLLKNAKLVIDGIIAMASNIGPAISNSMKLTGLGQIQNMLKEYNVFGQAISKPIGRDWSMEIGYIKSMAVEAKKAGVNTTELDKIVKDLGVGSRLTSKEMGVIQTTVTQMQAYLSGNTEALMNNVKSQMADTALDMVDSVANFGVQAGKELVNGLTIIVDKVAGVLDVAGKKINDRFFGQVLKGGGDGGAKGGTGGFGELEMGEMPKFAGVSGALEGTISNMKKFGAALENYTPTSKFELDVDTSMPKLTEFSDGLEDVVDRMKKMNIEPITHDIGEDIRNVYSTPSTTTGTGADYYSKLGSGMIGAGEIGQGKREKKKVDKAEKREYEANYADYYKQITDDRLQREKELSAAMFSKLSAAVLSGMDTSKLNEKGAKVGTYVKNVGSSIASNAADVMSGKKDIGSAALDVGATILEPMFAAIGGAIFIPLVSLFEPLMGGLEGIGAALGSMLVPIFTMLQPAFDLIGVVLGNVIAPVLEAIGGVFTFLYDNVFRHVVNFFIGFMHGLGGILSWLGGIDILGWKPFEALKGTGDALQGIKFLGTQAEETAKKQEKFGKAVDATTDALKNIPEGFKVAAKVYEAITPKDNVKRGSIAANKMDSEKPAATKRGIKQEDSTTAAEKTTVPQPIQIIFQGPVYGMDDFDTRVKLATRRANFVMNGVK